MGLTERGAFIIVYSVDPAVAVSRGGCPCRVPPFNLFIYFIFLKWIACKDSNHLYLVYWVDPAVAVSRGGCSAGFLLLNCLFIDFNFS